MYAVERNPKNYQEVNTFFNKLNGRGYSANGTYFNPNKGIRVLHDYIHYPFCKK